MRKHLSKKSLLSLTVALAIIVAGAVLFVMKERAGAPGDSAKPSARSSDSFLLNEEYYDCSRPIAGEYKPAKVGQLGDDGYYFHPDSQEEFKKYCRVSSVIEYHAVLEVLKKPDIAEIIEKYPTHSAWVKALSAEYIKDADYMDRILPKYKDMNIHCIIVVHSPEGSRFFLEDGDKDHEYVDVPAEEFLASLNSAPDTDVNNFWLGLH